jgi:hypothetical protein
MSAIPASHTRSASIETRAGVRLRRDGEAPRELVSASRRCPEANARVKRGSMLSTRHGASLPKGSGNAARIGDAHQAQ